MMLCKTARSPLLSTVSRRPLRIRPLCRWWWLVLLPLIVGAPVSAARPALPAGLHTAAAVAVGAADRNVLLEEDFESVEGETRADRLSGWRMDEGASGIVRELPGSDGRALGFNSGNITREWSSGSPDEVSWVDMRIKVRPMSDEPAIREDTSAAFYFTPRGQLRVNNGGVWQDARTAPVNLNEWQRIVTKMNYGASPQTWSIWLNGHVAGVDLRFANRVDQFGKITFGNESSADSYLDRLEIGAGEPVIPPVAKVAEPPVEKPEIPPVAKGADRPAEKKPETPAADKTTETPTVDRPEARPAASPEDGTVAGATEPARQDPAARGAAPATPHPVLPPAALFLVPVAVLGGLFLRTRSSQPKCSLVEQAGAFSALALLAVLLYFVFPPVEAAAGRSVFLLAAGLALYLGGLGFWLIRRDRPEEISILFRIAPFVGVAGLLLIGVGAVVPLAIGIGLFSVGWLFGLVGCLTFVESGVRGARSFIAGIAAAMAGPALILQQMNTTGWILLVSYCAIPLCFGVPDARRKLKKQEQIRQFESKGKLKRPVILEETDAIDEVVVKVPREKKPKRSRKGPSRSRSASKERPVIISRDQKAEGGEGEEEAPFFGEGVLATEPGRQGNIRLDPWTGAAVQEGGEEESSEEMERFNPEEGEEEAFPEMQPFGDEEGEEFPEMQPFGDEEAEDFSDGESADTEEGKEEDGNKDERRS